MKGFIVAVVIVAVVVGLVPLSTVTYYVDEPYQAQVEKPLSYYEINSNAYDELDFFLGAYVQCFVVIENIDTVPGMFAVDFIVTTLNRTFTGSDSAYILPGGRATLEFVADITFLEDWNWNRIITPGTKTVTELRYRSVAYQKKVPILDYLQNY